MGNCEGTGRRTGSGGGDRTDDMYQSEVDADVLVGRGDGDAGAVAARAESVVEVSASRVIQPVIQGPL